jgi:parallel beta-helix repeat protein
MDSRTRISQKEKTMKDLAKMLFFGAVLALFLAVGVEDSTDASHAGGMDLMAFDMNPAGTPANTGTSLGSKEDCARINENNMLDADEDAFDDTISMDVTAVTIPASNPAVAFSLRLNYDESNLFVAAVDGSSTIFGGAGINPTEPTPDTNNNGIFSVDVLTSASTGASGSGRIMGMDIETESAAAAGIYTLGISHAAHIDDDNNIQIPDSLAGGQIAVGTACPATFLVDTSSDAGGLSACSALPGDCSLRGAITNANTIPGADNISFSIGSGAQVIMPTSALPAVTAPVAIDGSTQPGCGSYPCIALYGVSAGAADGLTITGTGIVVSAIGVSGFTGAGISIGGSGNTITDNSITANGGAGVAVTSGTGNTIEGNSIGSNGGLGIDLGTTGVTPNDVPGYPSIPDTDVGANDLQNFPAITSVLNKAGVETVVAARLDSTPETSHAYAGYHGGVCGGGAHAGSSAGPELDMDGIGSASMLLQTGVPVGNFYSQTATSPGGSTSEFSSCVQVVGDADYDAVEDSIDTGTATFSDIPLGGSGDTFGSVTTTGGLSLSIVEDTNPEGVIIAAAGTGTTAELNVCGFPDPLELTSGDVVDVDCGSAKFQTKVGPVFFRIGTIATEMPADTTTTLTVISGVVHVTVDPASLQPVITGGLVIFPGQTVPVEDIDFDGLVGQADDDDDADLVGDVAEIACGSDPLDITPPLSRPERIDGPFAGVDDDGNEGVDEPLPMGTGAYDCDGDGYTRAAEDHVYSYIGQTNGDQKTCQEYDLSFPSPISAIRPSLRWPADVNMSTDPPVSFNQVSLLDLTSFLAPVRYFGTDVGTNTSDVRFDLVPGPGQFLEDINIEDLVALLAGGAGFPPMFNYARAFGAGACPYAP